VEARGRTPQIEFRGAVLRGAVPQEAPGDGSVGVFAARDGGGQGGARAEEDAEALHGEGQADADGREGGFVAGRES